MAELLIGCVAKTDDAADTLLRCVGCAFRIPGCDAIVFRVYPSIRKVLQKQTGRGLDPFRAQTIVANQESIGPPVSYKLKLNSTPF